MQFPCPGLCFSTAPWAQISWSPMRSCLGIREQKVLPQSWWQRFLRAARMDVRMDSATEEQDWALPNSPERGSSPALQACAPSKLKDKICSYLVLYHWKCLSIPLCHGGTSVCGAGWGDLPSVTHWSLLPPLSDTWGSFWLTLVPIQLTAAGGERNEQDLHISVFPWG